MNLLMSVLVHEVRKSDGFHDCLDGIGLVRWEAALLERMPERSILDMLANVSSWTQCFRHLGPLSGSEPKLADPVQRYILTVFGCFHLV